MKSTIIIRPIKAKTATIFGNYNSKELGKTFTLTTDGNIVDRALLPNEKSFMFSFTPQRTELRYDLEFENPNSFQFEKHKALIKFWENHIFVKNLTGRNDHLLNDLFTLEIVNDVTDRDVKEIKDKGEVFTIVNNLPFEKQRDICFMFGGNPVNKSDGEVFLDLLAPLTGRLMIHYKEFLSKWKNKNNDLEVIVTAKKAITLGIIETKSNNYFIGQELIGSGANGVDDVIGYLKSNHKVIDYLLSEIKKKDVIRKVEKVEVGAQVREQFMPTPTLNIDKIEKEKVISTNIGEQLDEKALREKAKNLGVKSWHVKSPVILNKEIKELQEK